MAERTHLSIGEVLSLLREEFPDVTISKIRFLESQGLVDPERTPSGYRKFYDHDVERLRWILRQQRENFLPLKIIRGRLTEQGEELDEGEVAGSGDGIPDGAEGSPAGGESAARQRQELLEAASSAHPAAASRPTGTSGGGGPAPRGAEAPGGAEVAVGTAAGASTSGSADPALGRQAPPAGHGAPTGREDATTSRQGRPAAAGTPAGQGAGAGRAPLPGDAPPLGPAVPAGQEPAAPRAARPGSTGPAATTGSSLSPSPGAPTGRSAAPASSPATGSNVGGRHTASGPARPESGADPGLRPGARGRAGTGQQAALDDEAETFSAEELAEACGGTVAMVTDLQQYGLITARIMVGGTPYFDAAALDVARAAAGFSRHGVEARHLRAWRNAADREAGIFEQVIVPLLRQRNPEARRQAAATLAELATLGGDLRKALLDRALRQIR